MKWDEVMRNISKGKDGRDIILANPILMKTIEDAEPKEKQRNKRKRFLENILQNKDGMIWLFVIERFRQKMKSVAEEKNFNGLNAVLDEWDEQGKRPQTNDSLTQVLLSFAHEDVEIPIEFQCFSVIAHCRRIRGGSGVINENAEIARKLSKDAKNSLDASKTGRRLAQNQNAPSKNFSITPSSFFELAIDLQQLLCESRFGQINDVLEKAQLLKEDIEAEPGFSKFDHRPDLNLLWWTNLVKLRCAAVCSDLVSWEKIRKEMDELEDDDGISGLLEYNKGRSTNFRNDELNTYRRIVAVNELLGEWRNFHENIEENEFVRKSRNSKSPKQRNLLDNVHLRYRAFNRKLEEFKLFTHHFEERNLPSHVKHTYSVRNKDRRNKSSRIIAETSTAAQSISLSDIFYTVHVLDILHRLLIYRLWWESKGYDGKSDLFSNKHVLDIVSKIRLEIDIRTDSNNILDEVDFSIAQLESLEEKDSKDFNATLQLIVERWEGIDDDFRKSPFIKNSIMGIKFTTNEKGREGEKGRPSNPHEYIDPMMPMVGPKHDQIPEEHD